MVFDIEEHCLKEWSEKSKILFKKSGPLQLGNNKIW